MERSLIQLFCPFHKSVQIWYNNSHLLIVSLSLIYPNSGVNQPQTKVVYILSISSEPSRNMSGLLKVYFSGNTPLINGFSITVQVFTSKPAIAICRLGQTKTMPCELLLSQYQCVKCSWDFIPAVCI